MCEPLHKICLAMHLKRAFSPYFIGLPAFCHSVKTLRDEPEIDKLCQFLTLNLRFKAARVGGG